MIAVRLQVEGVDLDDDLTNDLLAERFSDYLWSSVEGLVTMTVFIEEGDVVSHVIDAARCVENAIKGANVRRVHRDLVTQSDIASRVGVSREAIRKWTHRGGDKPFPAPFDTVGGDTRPSKVWQWSDVVAWLEDVYCIEMHEDLPDEETVAHIDACLAKVNGYLDKEWRMVTTAKEAQMEMGPAPVLLFAAKPKRGNVSAGGFETRGIIDGWLRDCQGRTLKVSERALGEWVPASA